jgi:2-phosphoglycerate kinase
MKDKQIILIGGAPTTGKSTIAQALSRKLDLPYISTDQIRVMLQAVANPVKYPGLFNTADYDAERFLTELTAEQIADMEFEQGEETWIGVKALVSDCDYEWRSGCVIEGVGILPKMVAQDFANDHRVRAIFLVDHDLSRMRDTIFARGLWDEPEAYGDHLKEKEVEWAALYGKRLEAEAKKYGYPWIEVHKDADDLRHVVSVIERT